MATVDTIEGKGVGAAVTFDGAAVRITRKGFAGAVTGGRGEKHIPVDQIAAVHLKPASALVNGYIQFLKSAQQAPSMGGEDAIGFRNAHQAAFAALHVAVQAAIPQRDVSARVVVAQGMNGAIVTFDGQTVAITRKGFAATMIGPGTGEKRIPVHAITAIQFKTSGISYYIQFSFSGESAQSSRSRDDRRKDENTVEFHAGQRPAFEALRDAIEAARTVPTPPTPMVVAPSVAERIQQLAGLRDQGLISEAEFEAKRVELLAQL